MAQNTTVNVPAMTWTQLTNSDTARITFQNASGYHVVVKATAGATAPTDLAGGIRYNPGQGERNVLLSELFPGLTGGNRVYAYAESGGVSVMVSHA